MLFFSFHPLILVIRPLINLCETQAECTVEISSFPEASGFAKAQGSHKSKGSRKKAQVLFSNSCFAPSLPQSAPKYFPSHCHQFYTSPLLLLRTLSRLPLFLKIHAVYLALFLPSVKTRLLNIQLPRACSRTLLRLHPCRDRQPLVSMHEAATSEIAVEVHDVKKSRFFFPRFAFFFPPYFRCGLVWHCRPKRFCQF